MYDDDHDAEERFRGRPKRRPRGRTRMRDLDAPDAAEPGAQEADPGLAHLRELGQVAEVLRELKSGKEADVLLARSDAGALLALKIYRDPSAGGFRPDPVYLEGRTAPRGRLRKILDRGARSGLPPDLAMWVLHEVRTLWTLHRAGILVPEPLIGPGAHQIAQAGRVVPMGFVGDADGTPAPRLADAELTPEAAQDAWRQAQEVTVAMLRAGLVHGDLSAWNLLWHRGWVVVIDVPQAVSADRNPHAAALFSRDVTSLVDSMKPHGIDEDPLQVEARLRSAAGLPERGPFP